MPPGHWNEIAGDIARDRNTSLADAARLFAWLSLAQADTAIACWATKYRYNIWRPVTAIRRADGDGNPLTDPEPGWDHFLASQILLRLHGRLDEVLTLQTSDDLIHWEQAGSFPASPGGVMVPHTVPASTQIRFFRVHSDRADQ